eukprot:3939003-Rhodomonas_salina.2
MTAFCFGQKICEYGVPCANGLSYCIVPSTPLPTTITLSALSNATIIPSGVDDIARKQTMAKTVHSSYGPENGTIKGRWPCILRETSKSYKLMIFTMGTRAYAHAKCIQLGIVQWVPLECVFSREDTILDSFNQHKRKAFSKILCDECLQHCIAVDDNPGFWSNKSPVVKYGHTKDCVLDVCLVELANFLKKHHDDI